MPISQQLCPTCAAGSGVRCRTRKGTPRAAHLRRLLATIVVLAVPAMVDWIGASDREQLTDRLLDRVLGEDSSDPGPDGSGGNGTHREHDVDFGHARLRLLAVDRSAVRLVRLLTDKRLDIDLTELRDEAGALAERIRETYYLIVKAGNNRELGVRRGDTPATIAAAIARDRARIVDAELPPVPPPAAGAPTWTVHHHPHGGFVATVTAGHTDTGPHRGWGYAPTPRSAVATVAGFTPHRPPVVVLSPEPRGPARWADYTSESDLSLQGQRVDDLLEERGTIYREHLRACERAAQRLRGVDLDAHLAERAALLNATDPQPARATMLVATQHPANPDHKGFFDTTLWVPTRLVVATSHTTWGQFRGHRQYMLKQIARGLVDAQDLEAFTADLFGDPIHLMHTPAWAGPIYRVGANGNHRLHVARMLDLPWLATTVTHETTPPAWESWSMASVESDWAETHWSEQWARRRHALIEGLIRRGIINGHFDDNPDLFNRTLHCTRLPAPWLVRAPELATVANTFYDKLYPGALAALGIPEHVGTDAEAWQTWLTTAP